MTKRTKTPKANRTCTDASGGHVWAHDVYDGTFRLFAVSNDQGGSRGVALTRDELDQLIAQLTALRDADEP